MCHFTLQQFERLPRGPEVRKYVRVLMPELIAIVRRAILAHMRGSEKEVREVSEAYATLRGKDGFPVSIAQYITKANNRTPRQIAIAVLHACRPTLSPRAIETYSTSSKGEEIDIDNPHNPPTVYKGQYMPAELYLSEAKYQAAEVLRLWYTGVPGNQIGVRLGLGKNLVGRMIHALCPHTCLRRGRKPFDYPKVSADEVVRLFDEDNTSAEIADELGTTRRIALKLFHRKRPNVSMKKHGRKARKDYYRKYPGIDTNEVVQRIHEGSTLRDEATRIGKSVETVRAIHFAMCTGACSRKHNRKRAEKVVV
jgi:DNA-binding CsgD family transcriptional regulator